MRAGAKTFFVVFLAVWAGIIIGVFLISTPVKFQAPLLTTAAGLDVGRYTFRLLSRIELAFIVVSLIGAWLAKPVRATAGALLAVFAAALLQHFWLLPVLDARVGRILAGESVPPSPNHTIFAAIEVLKAALLIAGAVLEYRAVLSRGAPRG